MPETGKQSITSRTASHSDVKDTPAARAYQKELTERIFGEALLRRLRETDGGTVRLGGLREEWLTTDEGLVHELCVEVLPENGASAARPEPAVAP